MRLVEKMDSSHPKECADMLNKHFHKQSVLDHQLSIQNCSKIGAVPSASEVVKMIKNLNT